MCVYRYNRLTLNGRSRDREKKRFERDVEWVVYGDEADVVMVDFMR
jgi:hypothetical protein